MANFVFHEIECENIVNKLIEKGVIYPYTFNRYGREQHYEYVLDYSKCDLEEWEEQKKEILEKGIITIETGGSESRRDYTENEIKELSLYPLQIEKDDNPNFIGYFCKWRPNGDPSYYISKALSNEIIKTRLFYEGRDDGSYCLKNGESCTLIGKKYISAIGHIKNSLIKDVEGQNNTVKVSIPWTNGFANIFINKEYVQPYMLNSTEYSDIFFEKDKLKVYQYGQVPVTLSVEEIKSISNESRKNYLSDLRKTPQIEREPIEEEADYEL